MRTWSAAVVVVLAGALGACSSEDDGSSSAATSSAADVCASADRFRDSLAGLKDVQIVQQGTDALTAAWTTVEDAWAQLADDARGTWAAEVDRVQADADTVRSAVTAVGDGASAATLGAATAAVGDFLQDSDALLDEVSSTC